MQFSITQDGIDPIPDLANHSTPALNALLRHQPKDVRQATLCLLNGGVWLGGWHRPGLIRRVATKLVRASLKWGGGAAEVREDASHVQAALALLRQSHATAATREFLRACRAER